MQTVVGPLAGEGQYHTGPRSLLRSYKIKSENLTFSLTRGPGAGSATITYGQKGQIEMKVVNGAHAEMPEIGGRERERERKRERRLVVR